MPRIANIFEGKEAQRTRIEAELAERSERFRSSPTIVIGNVVALNPTFEGPNPFNTSEMLNPEDHGVLKITDEEEYWNGVADENQRRRRARAKSEAYKKSPWTNEQLKRGTQSLEVARSPRFPTPPLDVEVIFEPEEDPFRKQPLGKTEIAPNAFFMDPEEDMREQKRRSRRITRTDFPTVDYLHVDIPDSRLV